MLMLRCKGPVLILHFKNKWGSDYQKNVKAEIIVGEGVTCSSLTSLKGVETSRCKTRGKHGELSLGDLALSCNLLIS